MIVDRAVIDTNIFISAALNPAGTPSRIVRYFIRSGSLLFSPATFAALESRLWRPKFDPYISIEGRKAFLHDLGAIADWVDIQEQPGFCGDADDDKFVETAINGQARVIVSSAGGHSPPYGSSAECDR